jgi:hypothetical protein
VERVRAKWHQNDARTAVLETQDESFNERDTSVLANGAEAGCDSLVITPILEHAAPELLAVWCKYSNEPYENVTGQCYG